MPINPAIAMSFQAPKFEDPMNRMIQMEQIKAYQQNALAKQLEAEIAQESLGQQRGLRNYLAGLEPGASPDMNMLARFGKTGREYGKDITEARSKQIEMASKLYKEKYLPILAQARTREDVLAWHGAMEKDPDVQPILTPQGKAMLPKSDAEVPSYLETTLVPIAKIYDRATAEISQGAAMGRAQYQAQVSMARDIIKEATYVDPVSGQVVRNPQISNEQLAAAEQFVNAFGGGAAPGGQPMPTDLNATVPGQQPSVVPPPVPVEGIPGTRTLEMRPTDQAVPTKLPTVPGQEATRTPLGQRGVLSQEELPNAQMRAIENKATAKKRADLKIDHPKTLTGLSTIMSEAEKTVAAIDRILTDPALQNVTGNWDGSVMMEGLNGLFSQASRNVQSDINFLKSRAFLGGVSKGIPGLAPLSDAESQGLQASEANLDIGQDTKKMGDSLIDYKLGIIRTANNKVREYNETFKDLGIPNWKPAPLYIPREAADQLLATRRTKAHINEFNKEFGEGAAEQVLKGATNGR
jgi:hypothetical protein